MLFWPRTKESHAPPAANGGEAAWIAGLNIKPGNDG